MAKQGEIDIIPSYFKLQWHITERCNFRCLHCYQENYDTPEMSLEQMEEVLKEFTGLVKKWKISKDHCELTITGGEPLLHKEIIPFLAKVYKYCENFRWAILSNGSLVSRENIKIMRLFKISCFQVSLEGLEENNDKIRGQGNFKKAMEAIKLLIDEGILVSVGLTITKDNKKDILPLARLLAEIGVKTFWVRRLIPWGSGSLLADSLLEPGELSELYLKIEEENDYLSKKYPGFFMPPGCENSFFSSARKLKSRCIISKGQIIALLPNGDIYPCRRLPIKMGNILESSLEEIFYSDKMKELRDIKNAPKFCRENCRFFDNCQGGAKCVTFASGGKLDIPDIQCPEAYFGIGAPKY